MRAVLSGAAPTSDAISREPAIYTGTSVGAFSAAVMGSQPGRPAAAAVERLAQLWLTRVASTLGGCGNGVFRLRGLPVQELDPGCFLHPVRGAMDFTRDSVYLAWQAAIRGARFMTSVQPLTTRVFESVDVSVFIDDEPLTRLIDQSIDYPALLTSGKEVRVVASNWENGDAKVFGNREVAATPETLLASMAIPGVFPEVELGGVPYVDGGLSMNTPLKPALGAGATELHVVYLDPLLEDSDYPETANTFDVMARVFVILTASQMKNDLRRARAINRGLRLLMGRGRGGLRDAGELLEALGEVEEALEDRREGHPRTLLTIHVYRPGGNLGNGADLLNFSQRQIERLLEQGYADTVGHDCEAAGCVLADERTN
jgi:predicted acylesterase/phospholipase RssA